MQILVDIFDTKCTYKKSDHTKRGAYPAF